MSLVLKTTSVIIAASSPDTVLYLLKSLDEQRKHIKEIIIVEDWTYEKDFRMSRLAREFGCIYERLPTPKRNPYDQRCGPCKSLGLKRATADIVLWMDEDCVPCLWYIERMIDIHNAFPNCAFNGHRIYMLESEQDFHREGNWKEKITQFDTSRKNFNEGFSFYKGFWDNTKNPPYGVYGNNLSASRENAIRVGDWINFFGYGEEDLYWAYKAYKLGIKGLYQNDPNKDLFTCHLRHEHRPYSSEFTCINRLWLYEKDPEFKKACEKVRGDWVVDEMNRILTYGLQSSPAFEYLIDVPDCLQKYVK